MLVSMIVLLVLSADAQLTVDDNGGSTFDQVVNLIIAEFKYVRTALTSNQQQQSVGGDTSSLCESLVACLDFILS